MPRWQYRVIDLSDLPREADDIDLLNAAGDEGWELVAITINAVAYLKRRLDNPGVAPSAPPSAQEWPFGFS
jgi:hypothetical protein